MKILKKIWAFYRDGFREMTWGRQLWWVVLLKVAVLFLVLRLFFFKPTLAGKTDAEKSEVVGEKLTHSIEN